MPLFNHENIGDVRRYVYITGIVTAIDSANDTVDLAITEPEEMTAAAVPLYYHCTTDAALRDNGAIEGAAGAFAVDDEVIVRCTKQDGASYEVQDVVGFTDGVKACEFYIYITLNGITPTTPKTIKLIDHNGDEHQKDSTVEDPNKFGPFSGSDVVFPVDVYLYYKGKDNDVLFAFWALDDEGNAPLIDVTPCSEGSSFEVALSGGAGDKYSRLEWKKGADLESSPGNNPSSPINFRA